MVIFSMYGVQECERDRLAVMQSLANSLLAAAQLKQFSKNFCH